MSLALMPTLMVRAAKTCRKEIAPKPPAEDQQRIKAEADHLASSFEEFVKSAWPLIDPGAPLVWEWHMEELCSVLQEAAQLCHSGEPTDWVIAQPPGSSKSNIVCILYQPWVWTWWPASRWITTTYEAGLAQSQSRKSRDLVLTDWYQERWPVRLTQGEQRQNRWGNTVGGGRICAGTGGTVTGSHGHFVLCDDIVAEQDARLGSPQVIARRMAEAEAFFFSTLGSRGIGKGATRILNGQRLHAKDPAARAIKEGYRTVIFPVHFDPDRADPRDQRKELGEILCPKLRGELYWDKDAIRLGPTATKAQHEQAPGSPEDMLLRLEYFKERWVRLPPALEDTRRIKRVGPGQYWITSWDLKFKKGVTKSWVTGQVWVRYQSRFYLIDQVRGHFSFLQSVAAITDMAKAYPWVNKHILEHAANADSCEDVLGGGLLDLVRMLGVDLSREETQLLRGIPGITLEPVGGGTFARTQACEGIWATGGVITPADAPWMGGSTGFIEEHVNFDGTGTTDQVSASSLALVHLGVKGNEGRDYQEAMATLRSKGLGRVVGFR